MIHCKADSRRSAIAVAVLFGLSFAAQAAPVISRLTPPSELFASGNPSPPYISRFIANQKFDLQATVQPDAGRTISSVELFMDGRSLTTIPGGYPNTSFVTTGLVAGLRANTRWSRCAATPRGYRVSIS